ncbi:hypothetical protein A176_002703 [Myxococcus hansupus]|uniref:Uncharacterized protein n=1 Tax=Pseudomyxococcus hansupus TaxID=1297742 RepID=A0A0H4WQJ1_9BACT|nr:hypothetical protein A176_002703 [Myxococcus hansupus]
MSADSASPLGGFGIRAAGPRRIRGPRPSTAGVGPVIALAVRDGSPRGSAEAAPSPCQRPRGRPPPPGREAHAP